MISKEYKYVQFICDSTLKNLLDEFSKETGYSISKICYSIVACYLPDEVYKYLNKKEEQKCEDVDG